MEWIKVTDRLPEIGSSDTICFICTKDGERCMAYLEEGTDAKGDPALFWTDFGGIGSSVISNVTHWSPLLEVPQP